MTEYIYIYIYIYIFHTEYIYIYCMYIYIAKYRAIAGKRHMSIKWKCLAKAVIYQATVTRANTGEPKTYVGLTANDFKSRYRNHVASFRNKKSRNSTELNKYIWSLKDSNTEFSIVWRIISRASPYNSASKRCNLCLNEKLIIIFEPHRCTLNRISELISSCGHRTKSLQCNN